MIAIERALMHVWRGWLVPYVLQVWNRSVGRWWPESRIVMLQCDWWKVIISIRSLFASAYGLNSDAPTICYQF
jgi:hypothetical protein